MEETNPTSKTKVFGLILLFVFLSAGLVSLYLNKDKTENIGNKQNTVDVNDDISKEPTVEESKTMLESNVRVKIPEVKSVKEININNLNKEVSVFLVAEAISIKITENIYLDGTSGWGFEYEVKKDLPEIHRQLFSLAEREPFNTIFSSRASNASFIMTQSSSVLVKIISEDYGEGSIKVYVSAQKK